MGIEKTVWENTLPKQGRAITPLHIKNASKITKNSKYVGHRGQALKKRLILFHICII